MIDLPTRIAGWIGGLLLIAAAFGGTYLTGRIHGRDAERAVWTERQIVAERAARQTETDLAGLAAKSAARQAQKEALLNDQANRQTAAWRAAMARVRDIRVPAAVGVQLDAAAFGVPEAPAVAEPPQAGTPAPAYTDAGRELSICRENYLRARKTAERLEEARRWYESLECGK